MIFTDKFDETDTLEVKEVGGFGEPMMIVRVVQEGDEANMNLTLIQVKYLASYLDNFVKRHEKHG